MEKSLRVVGKLDVWNGSSLKTFLLYIVFISSIFIGVVLYPSLSVIIGVLCCVLIFFGPKKTIQAVSIFVLIRFLNPAIVTLPANLGAFSWVILILASTINIPWGFIYLKKVFFSILIFCFVVLVLSVITSSAVWISILKIISFLLGSLMALSVFNRLDSLQLRDIVIWFFSLFFVVVILSLFTLIDRGIAFNLNGTGFQGILNHPQTLGVFLAPISSYFMGRFMFVSKKIFSIDVVIFLILICLIFISQTRTSALSVFLSFISTIFVLIFPKIKAQIRSKVGFATKFFLGVIILSLTFIFYEPANNLMTSFIFKRESSSFDEALTSRSRGVTSQWNNFLNSPIVGNGFGVYPGPLPSKGIQYFMGIPISAAVEKGFLPTAVLEEVGIIGALMFIYMLFTISALILRNKDPSWLCVFFATIFINIGEFVFFATGGMGIFYWLIIGLCSVAYKMERR